MPEILVNEVPISFPFDPYELQKVYMSRVIDCLQNGTNGVLESPTGTGKTLCLLCATMGWILVRKAAFQAKMRLLKTKSGNNKDDIMGQLEDASGDSSNLAVPKVIYASRTHSQLTQVMQELKRTQYNHVKTAVIGSRDQLCIHPDVTKEPNNSAKIQMCRLKVNSRSCHFYNRVDKMKDDPKFHSGIMDIEDLVKAGEKAKVCPFFMSKDMVQHADITFMPYNYLLDPKARRSNQIELENTIIILDEAHNVEKMCEESASNMITSADLALCIQDVTFAMKKMADNAAIPAEIDEMTSDFSIDDLAILKDMVLCLEKELDNIEVKTLQDGVTFDGDFMIEFLAKAKITTGSAAFIIALLDKLIQFITASTAEQGFARSGGGLQKLSDLLLTVFDEKSPDFIQRLKKCYRVHIVLEEPDKNSKTMNKTVQSKVIGKILNFWCFNPGFGMQKLLRKNVRSIILTSGTLAPLKPLITELAIPINIRLENPHIIDASQVCVKIISHGPDKEPLLSNYKNRDNPKYMSSMGRTVMSIVQVVPDGVLVFFPSYTMLLKCKEAWQELGLWDQIQRHKTIFVEPRIKEDFVSTMAEYYSRISQSKGAVFMAVCRGKVSEGLDFNDTNARAVIITGIPYAPVMDPRVVLKKKYLERNRTKENELMTGDEWYQLEAIRAVNQAIGRVIRHKNDYGAILLCDQRFGYSFQKQKLSVWIQDHLKQPQPQTFGPAIGYIARFFRNAEKTLPAPIIKAPPKYSPSKKQEPISPSKGKINKANIKPSNLTLDDDLELPRKVKSIDIEQYIDFTDTDSLQNASLDTEVKTINFNTMPSSSAHLTAFGVMYKRNREDQTASSSSQDTSGKRKKFKLMPNKIISVDISQESSVNSSAESNEDQSLEAKKTEKRRLLKEIKATLDSETYQQFVLRLTQYHSKDSLQELLDFLKKSIMNGAISKELPTKLKIFIKSKDQLKLIDFIDML